MNRELASEAYRQSSIEHAPPIKIVRLLYEGALKFIDRAEREDPEDPKSRFSEYVGKADDIISELRLALDGEQSPGVTTDLERLYLFAESRLGAAQLDRTLEPLPEVRAVLSVLLDAWKQVEIDTTRVA